MATPARRRSKFINNSPYFFKVVSAPANQGLRIPISFMYEYGGSLNSSTAVVLKVPTGASSRVQLRRTNSGTWLGQGWEDFASYYGIKLCDFVVFRHAGNSEFDVTIFDERATQIQYSVESSEEDNVVEISEPGKAKKRQKNVLTLASSSSESSEEEDVEMYEPPEPAICKQRKAKGVQKNASFSFDSSEEDDVEMYEPRGPAIRKQRNLNKMQKKKVKLALSSSESSSEEEDVEIYELPVTAIRKQRKTNIFTQKNILVKLEEDAKIYESPGTTIRRKRKANKMQKNKLKLEEDVEILEPLGSANRKPREANKMQKSKFKLTSSSSESSEEEDVEIYELPEPMIRKQIKANIMQKNKVKLEEDSESDEPLVPAFAKQRKANKMQKDKLKLASSSSESSEEDDDVENMEPGSAIGKQRIAGKAVGFDKKKEYMSYKRAEAFTSENPFFLVFMQPSYVSNRFILSFNLASAGHVIPKNESSSCKMQVRVPGRHWKVWELSCNLYWKQKRANVLRGWKYFALDNKLRVGDVCVFELVEGNLLDFNITIFRK